MSPRGAERVGRPAAPRGYGGAMSTGPNEQDDTYGDYSVEESDQLTGEDTLADLYRRS